MTQSKPVRQRASKTVNSAKVLSPAALQKLSYLLSQAVCEAELLPLVQYLLATPGINVNYYYSEEREERDVPLIYASVAGNLEIVKALLAAGINVNVRDGDGETALMKVVERGNIEIVKALLAAPGINVNVKNWRGKSALILAREVCNRKIVRLLKNHGAQSYNYTPPQQGFSR